MRGIRHLLTFYSSKKIYHSEYEGELDMFVYIFRHLSHSSSLCLYPKLSKARVIVVRSDESWLTTLGEHMPKFFSGSDLSFFARGGEVFLQEMKVNLHDLFMSIIHSIYMFYISNDQI